MSNNEHIEPDQGFTNRSDIHELHGDPNSPDDYGRHVINLGVLDEGNAPPAGDMGAEQLGLFDTVSQRERVAAILEGARAHLGDRRKGPLPAVVSRHVATLALNEAARSGQLGERNKRS